MPAFIFNSAPTGNFATSNYYLVPVTATPLITNTTRANVAEVAGFTPVLLSNKVVSPSSLTFDDYTIPAFTYPLTVFGLVLVEKVGMSAPTSTDAVVSYVPFTNSLGQEFTASPGTFSIPVDFGVDGAIKIQGVYRYSSGAYVNGANGGLPNGIITLMGTRNNTVAFANPHNTTKLSVINGTGGLVDTLTDRVNGNSIGSAVWGFDFLTGRIRVTDLGVRSDNLAIPFTWHGSNNLTAGFTAAGLVVSGDWTLLASGTTIANDWRILTSSDVTTFWRYLKLTPNSLSNGQYYREVEFYNSTIESTTLNIVP